MSWEVSTHAANETVSIIDPDTYAVIADLTEVDGSYEERLKRAWTICVLRNNHSAMMHEVGRAIEAS